MLSFQLVHVPHHYDSGDDCGSEVGDRHTVPYSINVPYHRQESQERQENEQLSREREEDAYLHLSDALEEVGDNHLEPDDREAEHHYSDCLNAQVYQLLIGCKQSCAVVRQEHCYQPARYHDGGGGNDADIEDSNANDEENSTEEDVQEEPTPDPEAIWKNDENKPQPVHKKSAVKKVARKGSGFLR